MEFGLTLIVHAVIAVLLIIELGLTGQTVHVTHGHVSSFNFMLFNSVWTVAVLLYLSLAPLVLPSLIGAASSLTINSLTTLFWFAGSIAMADHIGIPHCHGNGACQTAQAAVAFGFFIWAAFTALTVKDAIAFKRGGSPRKPGQVGV